MKKNVLIDCDPGIDDAFALLFALSSQKLDVKAVTTVYGNVGVKQCTRNLLGILDISGRENLPDIGMGSSAPLKKKRLRKRDVHGKDGLGNSGIGRNNLKVCVKDAVDLAVTKILSGSVDYIIATGPLTNIARVIRKDRRVPDLVKRIYIMGGAISVGGNITPFAEFNIYNDPEAASIVFNSDIPKTLVSLDVTRKVLLKDRDIGQLTGLGGDLGSFIGDLAAFSRNFNTRFRNARGVSMHDPLCVGVSAYNAICSYDIGYFDVRLSGRERGRIVPAAKTRTGEKRRIAYCKDVDVTKFKKIFLNTIKSLIKEELN